MSTSLLDHAFGIRGPEYTRTDSQNGEAIFTIHQDPKTCRCSACGLPDVHSRGRVERRFGGEKAPRGGAAPILLQH